MNKPSPSRQVCFVDMPFGKKIDPRSRTEIDFDKVYENAIRPAVEAAGLDCVRGDQEQTGGIIHAAMLGRLLLAEFVVADLTTANPNVFYELGVRHTAKPYTTIPIFAAVGELPFDVTMVRAIPYDLEEGVLVPEAAKELKEKLQNRLRRALEGPVTKDSPLFQLFDGFPGIEMSHELTDVFRDRVKYCQQLKSELSAARQLKPQQSAIEELGRIERTFGDLRTLERGVLVDLMLSYRATEAWDQLVDLYDRMPADVAQAPVVRQQLGFALNRRNQGSDRVRAIQILEELIDEFGDSAETLGILARIHKDRFTDARENNDPAADGYLDLAIEGYSRGFEAEPADYYPGVNALNLLLQKNDEASRLEILRLAPLVTYAAVRRGGEKARDYWTAATVLELACISGDYGLAERVLPRALSFPAMEAWMYRTTTRNLNLLSDTREQEADRSRIEAIIAMLVAAADRLEG